MSIVTRQAAFGPARASRCRTVVCQANGNLASRRTALGVALLPLVAFVPKAKALIPDEEDDDLLEKAKANRRTRLAQQRGVTRSFMASENLKDAKLEGELVPVQKAVYKLAKSGNQLEAGDLAGAASTLGESWVAEFVTAAGTVSGAAAADTLGSGVKGVQQAAAAGDAAGAKRAFVALAGELQGWVAESGLSSRLVGL